MPAPAERQQQLHGAGGNGRGHVGLEAQLPDPQIGGGHQFRQLPGEAVIIMGEGVGDHQPLTVRTIAAAIQQEAAEPGILLGKIGRTGVHDPQSEALDLFRPKPLPVPLAVGPLVGGQIRRLAQGIHRVGQYNKESPESRLPGLPGVVLHQRPVGAELGHPHVPDTASHRRNAASGGEEEHITAEQVPGRYRLHCRKGVVVPGPGYLLHLRDPAGHSLLIQVADTDALNTVASQELQRRQKGAAHISYRQQIHPQAAWQMHGGRLGKVSPAGVADVNRPQQPGVDGVLEAFGQGGDRNAHPGGVQPGHILRLRSELPGV